MQRARHPPGQGLLRLQASVLANLGHLAGPGRRKDVVGRCYQFARPTCPNLQKRSMGDGVLQRCSTKSKAWRVLVLCVSVRWPE